VGDEERHGDVLADTVQVDPAYLDEATKIADRI
jgi:hypothetical protein